MRTSLRILVLLCCLALLGIQPQSADTLPPVQASMLAEEDLQQIDTILDSLANVDNILSFSLSENDQVIKSRYYNGAKADDKNNVFSVTKSITSLLVGMAIEDSYFTGVDQRIDTLIDADDYPLSEEQAAICIEDILTMTMGLYWKSDLTSEYHSLKSSDDPLRFILDRKLVSTPGTRFNYSDGAAHLMSILFTKATGTSLHDYAKEKLFKPLGIENTQWNADRNGNNYGGVDLYLSNEDMMKIGQLMANNGLYAGQNIVSPAWIAASTKPLAKTGSSASHNKHYGYYWWIGDAADIDLYAAIGHGGQFIYIVPELSLVITAASYGVVADSAADRTFKALRNAIVNKILPLYAKSLANAPV